MTDPQRGRARRRNPAICAVVVTFNRAEMLDRCLTALVSQTYPPTGIVVVDNDSRDATDRVLERWATKASLPTTVVRMPENVGSASAFALGMQAAFASGYEWAWVMDDDPVPEGRALARLARLARRTLPGQAAAFSSVQWDPSLDKYNAGFLWRGLPHAVSRGWIDQGRPYAVDLAPFCGFLVNRTLAEDVGYPRGDFFARFEDYEYCLRIRERGIPVFVDPRSRMVHPLGQRNAAGHVVTRDAAWKAYYDMRNRVFTTVHIRGSWGELFQELRFGLLQSAREVVLDRHRGIPNAWARVSGVLDGLSGRMGKTMDPVGHRRSKGPRDPRNLGPRCDDASWIHGFGESQASGRSGGA